MSFLYSFYFTVAKVQRFFEGRKKRREKVGLFAGFDDSAFDLKDGNDGQMVADAASP